MKTSHEQCNQSGSAKARERSAAIGAGNELAIAEIKVVCRVGGERYERPVEKPDSFVARLTRTRGTPQSRPSSVAPLVEPAPHRTLGAGTLLDPPGRASGNPVPPLQGLPPVSAGPEAPQAEPRLAVESQACRQAPSAGPFTLTPGDRPMTASQLSFHFDATTSPTAILSVPPTTTAEPTTTARLTDQVSTQPVSPSVANSSVASGEKAKARELLEAVPPSSSSRLGARPPPDEQAILRRFSGFSPLARSIFRNPTTGRTRILPGKRSARAKSLLTSEEYASAKQSTFNAFYTSPAVIKRSTGQFTGLAFPNKLSSNRAAAATRTTRRKSRFIGVELDLISGQIARALHPPIRDTHRELLRHGAASRSDRRSWATCRSPISSSTIAAKTLVARLLLRQIGGGLAPAACSHS